MSSADHCTTKPWSVWRVASTSIPVAGGVVSWRNLATITRSRSARLPSYPSAQMPDPRRP